MPSRPTHSTPSARLAVLILALLSLGSPATGEGVVTLADGTQAPPHPFDLAIAAAENGPEELREVYRHLLGLSGVAEQVATGVTDLMERLTLEVDQGNYDSLGWAMHSHQDNRVRLEELIAAETLHALVPEGTEAADRILTITYLRHRILLRADAELLAGRSAEPETRPDIREALDACRLLDEAFLERVIEPRLEQMSRIGHDAESLTPYAH